MISYYWCTKISSNQLIIATMLDILAHPSSTTQLNHTNRSHASGTSTPSKIEVISPGPLWLIQNHTMKHGSYELRTTAHFGEILPLVQMFASELGVVLLLFTNVRWHYLQICESFCHCGFLADFVAKSHSEAVQHSVTIPKTVSHPLGCCSSDSAASREIGTAADC